MIANQVSNSFLKHQSQPPTRHTLLCASCRLRGVTYSEVALGAGIALAAGEGSADSLGNGMFPARAGDGAALLAAPKAGGGGSSAAERRHGAAGTRARQGNVPLPEGVALELDRHGGCGCVVA